MRLLPTLTMVSVVLAAGCRSAPPDDANALVLRTYEIPKGSARPILATLKDAFWAGQEEKMHGRAAITPDGRLAVLATGTVHTGVKSLVDEVAKHPPTYDQTIDLHYFIVVGKAEASPQPPPPGLAEIQPALDEIVRTQGPQTFTIGQRARLATMNGDSGKVEAERLKITQQASQTSDGVDALVGIDFSGHDRVETRVHLTPDRIAVLGATGQRSDPTDGTTLYYVVRVAPRGQQR